MPYYSHVARLAALNVRSAAGASLIQAPGARSRATRGREGIRGLFKTGAPGHDSPAWAPGQQRGGPPAQRLQVRMTYSACSFEVHGLVQGVWFRAYTIDKARQLGLVGWCMNTAQGTVKGELQGKKEDVEQMKVWLATEGSPMSQVERCDFSNERNDLKSPEYNTFDKRRSGY